MTRAQFSLSPLLRAANDGAFEPGALSQELRVSKSELAIAAGLSRDSVSKQSRVHSAATQRRLRDMAEILARVTPWAGSLPQAFAWYRAQPLPSFGDRTAEDMVKLGKAEEVKTYLSRIAAGGYA